MTSIILIYIAVQILDTDRSGSVSFEEFNEALKFGLLNGILAEAAQHEGQISEAQRGKGDLISTATNRVKYWHQ